MRRALVTGGAGFIGSHFTERLLEEDYMGKVADDFSNGNMENVRAVKDNPALTVVKKNSKKPAGLETLVEECDVILHLAANPEVRIGETEPKTHNT